jgi:Zn-dependent protease
MDIAVLITIYIVFVYSTVAHEAAHALVALKLGDQTAYLGGQVTLDPTPHIKREPFGMVFAPLISLFLFKGSFIGWASAPLDPLWVARYPRRSALVALAGPLANFILCIIAAVLMFIGAKNGVFVKPTPGGGMASFVAGQGGRAWELCALILSVLFSLNLLLGIFNLLPMPPLDGSNIPLLFMNERNAEVYQQALRQPWLMILTLVIALQLFPSIYWPLYFRTKFILHGWFFG